MAAPTVVSIDRAAGSQENTEHIQMETMSDPHGAHTVISLVDSEIHSFHTVLIGFGCYSPGVMRLVVSLKTICVNGDILTLNLVFPQRSSLIPFSTRWNPFANNNVSDGVFKDVDTGTRWGLKLTSIIVGWGDMASTFPFVERWEYNVNMRYRREAGPEWDIINRKVKILSPAVHKAFDSSTRMEFVNVA